MTSWDVTGACSGAAGPSGEPTASEHGSLGIAPPLCHLPSPGRHQFAKALCFVSSRPGHSGLALRACTQSLHSGLALPDWLSSWSQRAILSSIIVHHRHQTTLLPVTKSFPLHSVKSPSRLHLRQMFTFLLMAHLFNPL